MSKKYKLICSIFLMLIVIVTGTKTTSRAVFKTNLGIEKFIQPEMQNYQLISSVPAKGVSVYGKKLAGKPYFEQVLVKTPSSQREFNWKATMRNPRVVVADITGSGQESIVAIFVTAIGTGFIESKVHVVDMGLTREIPVEDASEAVKRLVSSSIQGQEILFRSGGKEFRVRPKAGAAGIQGEYRNLYYGSIVNYGVENNKLKATVTAETPYNIFLGEFTLVYNYRNGRLVPEVVNFISLT